MSDFNINLTVEQLEQNYNKLLSYVDMFNGKRKELILNMYDDLANQIAVAPASTMKQFHGCYPGGYVEHVLSVITVSIEMYKLWKRMGANMGGYTQEELIFSAMFHDLGKIGDKDVDFYVKNTSEWHRKNQGKLYTNNDKLKFMLHEHRSIYLLQKYGITFSANEYLAIMNHNGPFTEKDKVYWNLGIDKSKEFSNNLPIILHYADFMSYRIEVEKEGIIKPL